MLLLGVFKHGLRNFDAIQVSEHSDCRTVCALTRFVTADCDRVFDCRADGLSIELVCFDCLHLTDCAIQSSLFV